ncbi:hypothetical protein Lepto7375DRAFT_3936 [Leptolyngbya sp. PCC 7375]|nr:hypothetical protein Lepto7375DRAFT_3936 [Leptolyngbya sp. PCC 7375]
MDQLLGCIIFKSESVAELSLIRGLEVSVIIVLDALAQGASPQAVVVLYPILESDDVRAVCLYAFQLILRIPVLLVLVGEIRQQTLISMAEFTAAIQSDHSSFRPLDFDPNESSANGC